MAAPNTVMTIRPIHRIGPAATLWSGNRRVLLVECSCGWAGLGFDAAALELPIDRHLASAERQHNSGVAA